MRILSNLFVFYHYGTNLLALDVERGVDNSVAALHVGAAKRHKPHADILDNVARGQGKRAQLLCVNLLRL